MSFFMFLLISLILDLAMFLEFTTVCVHRKFNFDCNCYLGQIGSAITILSAHTVTGTLAQLQMTLMIWQDLCHLKR